ncbi:MAG: hypothetical protein AMJ59_07660 [Gammaproteobacteria bacterium SG8_31]|nr:MAG: hypothetical protein AMJ59_07660 [Gammaproteobacteria bacterium SG8_31]
MSSLLMTVNGWGPSTSTRLMRLPVTVTFSWTATSSWAIAVPAVPIATPERAARAARTAPLTPLLLSKPTSPAAPCGAGFRTRFPEP